MKILALVSAVYLFGAVLTIARVKLVEPEILKHARDEFERNVVAGLLGVLWPIFLVIYVGIGIACLFIHMVYWISVAVEKVMRWLNLID